MDPRPLRFPEDERPHPAVIEWWYVNGNVRDDAGRAYAFMYCLFKVDPKKVALPFFDRIPAPTLYFSHFLVSDIAGNSSEAGTRLFYEGMAGEDSRERLLTMRSREHFLLREYKPFAYTLQTDRLDLSLESQKPVMLVNGSGFVPVKATGAYYYSLTNLAATGTMQIGGNTVAVRGSAWMDHQWSDEPASSEDKWNWFSLQLEGNTELLCCEYGDREKIRFATISYPDGRTATTHNVRLTPSGAYWQSPKTEANYPIAWAIDLPDWDMHFTTAPKLVAQEVMFGSINYWEGAINVAGTHAGQRVSGAGFMEIVGVPMGKSVARLYLGEAERYISNYVKRYI